MHRQSVSRGFTLVELVIVMIVIAVIAALGTVAVGKIQVSARDQERRTDIQAFAAALENRYRTGNTKSSSPHSATYTAGSYPGENEIFHNIEWFQSQVASEILPGLTRQSITPPGSTPYISLICFTNTTGPCAGNTTTDSMSSTDRETTIRNHIWHLTNGGRETYVYEPITNDNKVCYQNDCSHYNLHYYEEETDSVKTYRSKRQ
ncbi:prepilin-type N-terminal cleavage/methylation domain-containing protein [Candidatus Nomurabacteria bacterium]|nr:prepilin-type N-terminal cleavage/methylation domain-containing protein [Candidatus Nomurabacteria bacterium]